VRPLSGWSGPEVSSQWGEVRIRRDALFSSAAVAIMTVPLRSSEANGGVILIPRGEPYEVGVDVR
jgi:hypothetical protein